MTRLLATALTLAAALLVLAAPAGAADPLTVTSPTPADGASVPLTPTGGIPWRITVAGAVPDDAGVSLTISSTGATGADGATLATADRVDFVFLSPNGAPGGWAGRTDPGPNAWSATAGTYFWRTRRDVDRRRGRVPPGRVRGFPPVPRDPGAGGARPVPGPAGAAGGRARRCGCPRSTPATTCAP